MSLAHVRPSTILVMPRRETDRAASARPAFGIAAMVFLILAVVPLCDQLFSLHPGVLGSSRADMMLEKYPLRAFGFEALRHGHLALWTPHIFSGAPIFGGFEAGLLYPPNWIQLTLPPAVAINWVIAFHLWLAGFLMWHWSRQRGAGETGSLLAGMCFMLSGPFFLRIRAGHLATLCALAWLPLLFSSMERWMRAGDRGSLVTGAFAAAMQWYAGQPQTAYYSGLLLACYCAALAWRYGRWRRFLGAAAIPSGAALLAAVQILAGVAAARDGVRASGVSANFAALSSLPFENLITLITPFALGDGVLMPYFGKSYLWEVCLYVGGLGTLLAALGLWKARPKDRWVVGAMLAISLSLSLGAHLPALFHLLRVAVPGFRYFRGASKFGAFVVLFLCAHVGIGWDALIGSKRASRAMAVLACAISMATLLLAIALPRDARAGNGLWQRGLAAIQGSNERLEAAENFQYDAFPKDAAAFASRELLSTGVLLFAAALFFLGASFSRKLANGVVVLAAIEMLAFARSARSVAPGPPPLPQEWRQRLDSDAGDYRVLHRDVRFADYGMIEGYRNIWGYNPFVVKRYAEFVFFSQGMDPDRAWAAPSLPWNRFPPYMRLTRLRFAFDSAATGAVETYDKPLPHYLLLRRWRVLPSRDVIFHAMEESSFSPDREVLLESAPAPVPGFDEIGDRLSSREVVDGADLDIQLGSPAILLATDPYSRGWRVRSTSPTNPQRSYEVLPADYAFQAVPLAAGRHRFKIEYSPLEFRIGEWISVLAWAAFLGLCIYQYRSRRVRL